MEVAIVGKEEGVYDGVEVHQDAGQGDECEDEAQSREKVATAEYEEWLQVGKLADPGDHSQWEENEVWEQERPGEEGDERPDVEHLWQVDCGDVVRLVAEDDASVPGDERCKGEDERDVWCQG